MSLAKQDTIRLLQREILKLQGLEKSSSVESVDFCLEALTDHFPGRCFPQAAIHEFLSAGAETAAATASFVSGLTGRLMQPGGACLWISSSRLLNPSALKQFGIEPDRVVFIDLRKEKEVLWAVEEALKCEGVAAVIGEVRELDFTASRRLQIAVEKSRTTGFILRDHPRNINPNACVARWQIKPLGSQVPTPDMPGLGFLRWWVDLLRVKNGQPGRWQLEWVAGRFQTISTAESPLLQREPHRRAG